MTGVCAVCVWVCRHALLVLCTSQEALLSSLSQDLTRVRPSPLLTYCPLSAVLTATLCALYVCRWCRAVAVGVSVRRSTTRGKAPPLPCLVPLCPLNGLYCGGACDCGGRHSVQSLIASGGPDLPSVPSASLDGTPNPLHHTPLRLDNPSAPTHGPPPPKPPRPPRSCKGKKKDNTR